jgi:ABC-type branched-subunit amino acid transport system ATPase component/ABC-type branched-subunit amino acid transport system permease subunit
MWRDALRGRSSASVAIGGLSLVVVVLGFWAPTSQVRQALILAVFYAAMASSYTLVIGYARILAFAHAALIGVGAYAYALLNLRAGLSVPLSFVGAMAVAAAVNGMLALLTARFRHFQLGIITLALALAFIAGVNTFPAFTGGGTGLAGFQTVISPSASETAQYAVAVISYAVVALALAAIVGSRRGTRIIATGDDEFLASAVGLNPLGVRAEAMAFSGALAGFVGAMYAQSLFVLTPHNFETILLIDLMIIIFVGGDRTVLGILAAALLTTALPLAAGLGSDWLRFGFGIVLALVLLLRPHGLYPAAVRGRGRALRSRKAARARAGGAPDTSAPEVTLSAKGIRKHFGGVQALAGVSFEVSGGQILGIVGPNGSGKTTLLNCVSGFVTPDDGEVTLRVDGVNRSLVALRSFERTNMGVGRSFQTPRVFVGLGVRDNLEVARSSRSSAAADDLDEVIERWPLPSVHEQADRLTHAQRRWLELARLEFMGCHVLLLDEPAAGLGDAERDSLVEHLRRLRSLGKAIVLVEHDLALVSSVSDQILVMGEGRTVAVGDARSLAGDANVKAVIGDRLGTFADVSSTPSRNALRPGH